MIDVFNPIFLRSILIFLLLIGVTLFALKSSRDLTSKVFVANTKFLYSACIMLFINSIIHLFGWESFFKFLDRRRIVLYESSYIFYIYFMSYFYYKSLKIENIKSSRLFDLLYIVFSYVGVFVSSRELLCSTVQTYIHDSSLYMILLNKGFMLTTTLDPIILFFIRYNPVIFIFIVLYKRVSKGLDKKDSSGARLLLVVSKGILAYVMAEIIQMISTIYMFSHPYFYMICLIPCYILRILMIKSSFHILDNSLLPVVCFTIVFSQCVACLLIFLAMSCRTNIFKFNTV